MKILLLHDYGTPTGGAELQMLSLREGLLAQGHEVLLFSSDAQHVQGFPQLADETCYGTHSSLQVLTQTANPSAYYRLRQVIRRFQPDVVHIRMFLWQLSPLILPLLKNIPVIYQTAVYKAVCPAGTNLLPDGSRCRFLPGQVCLTSGCLTWRTWMVLMVQWQLLEKWRFVIDRTVALSHAMKTELEAAGLSSIDVIHNGVPVRSMRPPLNDPPTVAYAGRLVPEKGVAVLLRAFAIAQRHHSQARLVIAGQGKEEPQLKELAKQLEIAENIVWLGHISREDLEQQFEQAWVQVVPSLWAEPFGNVTTEAMMRGTSVIASAVGAQPEIVDDPTTGFLVPPGDVDALAEKLTRLLGHRSLAEAMGQAGRDRAIAHFSEQRRTEQFLHLYESVRQQYLHQPVAYSYPKVSSTP